MTKVHHYNLGFISDEAIYQHVRKTVLEYRREIDLKQFNQNIVDPIKLSFDAQVYGKTIEQVIFDECLRQIDKTNSNAIGYFHQNLFKHAPKGWVVPKSGFDVENPKRHIFVEMKNKHNTMNSASAKNTYIKMQRKLLEDDEAVCYLVEAIAKHSRDDAWKITLDKVQTSHKKIRRMSIDRFYAMVFDDDKAFFKLCMALPRIIRDVLDDDESLAITNTVFDELTTEHADVITGLYLLAYSTYAGFNDLTERQ